MKLATIKISDGTVIALKTGNRLLLIDRAYGALYNETSPPFLWDMRTLLEVGVMAFDEIHRLAERVETDQIEDSHFYIGEDEADFAPPIVNPNKIICIGQNYRDHCIEQNKPFPKRPILFSKFAFALTGHKCEIIKPGLTEKLDFEGELAFVIGKHCHRISQENAMDYIVGYSIFHDVSARDIQFTDKQWLRGKTFPTFAPMGPYLVTADEIIDPSDLHITTELNDSIMQDSRTSNMIFDVSYLVSFISQAIPLQPGDIVATGTPNGVGFFRKEPIFLHDGDRVDINIDLLGKLSNTVIDEAL
ncbi:fumarylacetoacetate hydrolase family protein [bacterium]|nr:fumarylacetoacetate hydrolase family protein [bacterium]